MTQEESIQAQTLEYARPAEFCKVFGEEMGHLFRLALLLTADHEKAEQCFVAGLEDAIEGKAVFKNWARSWSRRSVITNAIRMIAPLPSEATVTTDRSHPAKTSSEANASIKALMKLESFKRFVFVLSVLESYSDRECANLLNCTMQDVLAARVRALQEIGARGAFVESR